MGVFTCMQGCGVSPPAYTSDLDDAEVYADIAAVSRRELNIMGRMYLHPYLAVATDSAGGPQVDLTTFEYEPSLALNVLQQQDTTLALCQVNAQGMCAEDYIVLSQIVHLSERDAVVVVRSIRGSNTNRVLLIRLRHGRGGWKVSGSELTD